jgi:hypothetical protein
MRFLACLSALPHYMLSRYAILWCAVSFGIEASHRWTGRGGSGSDSDSGSAYRTGTGTGSTVCRQ